MAMAGAPSFEGAQGLAFCNGFGIGGNIPIDTTIALEFLPEVRYFSNAATVPHTDVLQHRRDLLPLLSIFQPIGVVVTTALAYGYIPHFSCLNQYNGIPSCAGEENLNPPDCIPARRDAEDGQPYCDRWQNRGWRLLLLTIGCISLAIFFLRFVIFAFQESPKYLINKGKDNQAVHVMQHIADFNKRPTNLTIGKFYELEQIHESGEMSENIRQATRRPGSTTSQTSKRGFQAWIKAWPESKRLQRGPGKWFQPAVAGIVDFLKRAKGLFDTWDKFRLVILVWLIYAFDFWGFSIVGECIWLSLSSQ